MSDKEKPLAKTYVVCSVVLEKDHKYLLVQEKKREVYGKWNLPGGRVDKGENFEQAAIREAKEESGFEVRVGKELIVLHESIDTAVLHAFSAEIVGGKLIYPKDEILDAQWFSFEEILSMKDELRNPRYIIPVIEASR